jgi:hypothetical protein
MTETVPTLVENSLWIAWGYLEATGELGNPDTAANHLLDTIETMIRQGERRRLLLSNKAIRSYQRFRTEQGLFLVYEQSLCHDERQMSHMLWRKPS